MKTFLFLCTSNSSFVFNDEYYMQVDGVAMDSPLGSIFTNIFLASQEQRVISDVRMSDLIRWFRYVDDVLAIFTAKSDLKSILCLLNSLHRNLKFAVECEQNNDIHFLDVNITFTDGKFHTSTQVKPFNIGLYLLWSSFTAKGYKIGLFICLIHRSFKICSNWKQFHTEITILMDVFKRLGYPVTTLDSIVAKYYL